MGSLFFGILRLVFRFGGYLLVGTGVLCLFNQAVGLGIILLIVGIVLALISGFFGNKSEEAEKKEIS